MGFVINGIQQIGIGVAEVKTVFNWYRKSLGFDILVFEDTATAKLMTRYTDGTAEERHAILALNMNGGGGLEIWQFKNRRPLSPLNSVKFGDLGINAMKVRSRDIEKSHSLLKVQHLNVLTDILDENCFFFQDPWENWVQVIANDYTFSKTKHHSGGILGAFIGVSDMERSLSFYTKILGYNIVAKDVTGSFQDLSKLPGGRGKFRRVLLEHDERQTGGFGEFYGPSQIELLQALERTPNTIYQDRLWGDLGFIHLCFDVRGMDALKVKAENMGTAFTVDSAKSFDMGNAAGRFGYLEDPDGTLIELVETHKVPILKKLGIGIDLKHRDPLKPLPKWLIALMRIHRVNSDV